MRVDVHFAVLWVLVEVQTGRVDNICVFEFKQDLVVCIGEQIPGKLNPVLFKCQTAGLVVNAYIFDHLSLEV